MGDAVQQATRRLREKHGDAARRARVDAEEIGRAISDLVETVRAGEARVRIDPVDGVSVTGGTITVGGAGPVGPDRSVAVNACAVDEAVTSPADAVRDAAHDAVLAGATWADVEAATREGTRKAMEERREQGVFARLRGTLGKYGLSGQLAGQLTGALRWEAEQLHEAGLLDPVPGR